MARNFLIATELTREDLVWFSSLPFEGLDKLEFLQSHLNNDIYEKAFSIIQKYFSNDDEDLAVAPTTDNNQFQFNADQSVPMDGFQF